MKNAERRAGLTTLCVAVSLIAVGCGSGTTGGSPTTPTRSAQTAEQGQGQGQGQGKGQGDAQNPTGTPGTPVQNQQNEVEFTGQVTALAGSLSRTSIDDRRYRDRHEWSDGLRQAAMSASQGRTNHRNQRHAPVERISAGKPCSHRGPGR